MTPATAASRFRPARESLHDLLKDGLWHSYDELYRACGLRYGARVHELKTEGYDIETRDLDVGQAYRLRSPDRGQPRESLVRVEMPRAEAERLASSLFVEPGIRMAARKAIKKHRGTR